MERIVGIDWASQKHQVEVQNPEGEVVLAKSYSAKLTGLFELRDDVLEMDVQPQDISVGIEDPTRPVVRVLLEAGMEVFILTPLKVDAVRPLYSEAEVKGDELDAHIICDELRVHRNIFYRLVPTPAAIGTLRQYHRALEDTKSDINRFSNGLRDKVRDYFPQFLELDWSITHRVMLDLLELIPTPEAVEDVSLEQIDEVLGRCRKHSAREVLEILSAQGPPLDERIVRSAAAVAGYLAGQLRAALQAEDRWDAKIQELLEEISQAQKSGELPSASSCGKVADDLAVVATNPSNAQQDSGPTNQASPSEDAPLSDIEIALSTPGVGVRTVAGLFAEGFQALVSLNREMLRRQSIAPVTKQTGKQTSGPDGPDPFVHRRYARNRTLNETMHHLGDSLQRQNAHYRARYVKMKDARNHTHGRACRQLTDQYLRVLFAMLRDRTTYDSNLHGATRR